MVFLQSLLSSTFAVFSLYNHYCFQALVSSGFFCLKPLLSLALIPQTGRKLKTYAVFVLSHAYFFLCNLQTLSKSQVVFEKKLIKNFFSFQCGVFNFKRRKSCFKCNASREESEKGGEGSDEVSNILTKSKSFLSTKKKSSKH